MSVPYTITLYTGDAKSIGYRWSVAIFFASQRKLTLEKEAKEKDSVTVPKLLNLAITWRQIFLVLEVR